MAEEPSLRKRYFYKLFTNLIGVPIGAVAQLMIPRGLGPKYYGDFSFLSNFFTQFIGFFDMGTSLAFYTKLSQRQKQIKLVSFYSYFVGIVGVLVVILVLISHITGAYRKIWPDEGLPYIYLALFLGIIVWISQVMSGMVDAWGLTVSAEIGKVLQKTMGLMLISVLFFYKKLTLFSYFLYYYITLLILILILIWVIRRNKSFAREHWKFDLTETKKYIVEFYEYSHPLFVCSLASMIVGIFDRWLLQIFGGSIKQGFFGLSYQVGSICFLFSSAMAPLISREFSMAYAKKDIASIAKLFRRHIPLLYSITAFIACFMAVNAGKITIIFGGEKFKDATLAVCIMSFYPIHQTYGYLSASVLYSTDQTKLYRNLGVLFMLLGAPVTYFLIAPRNYFGLDAGAAGLAIKMVVIQFFGVNMQLYYNAKFLRLPFWKYVAHQIIVVAIFVTCAACVTFLVDRVTSNYHSIIASFIVSGILYTLLIGILFNWKPIIFGLGKEEVRNVFGLLRGKLSF